VAEGPAVARFGADFEAHEVALVALGCLTTGALLFLAKAWQLIVTEVSGVTLLYASLLVLSRNSPYRLRIRLLAAYAFAVWFYCAVARITPALGTPLRDDVLLALDTAWLGQTPAILAERAAAPWLTDLLSLCYATYLLYLPIVVIHAVVVSNVASQRLGDYLFIGFAVGFAGYLLVPAVGPTFAFPEIFGGPVPDGSLSPIVRKLLTAGSSGFDVFPSLHALITCILLDHDWRHVRPRFWIMIVPAIGMLISTIYLRYHYAVDLIAGVLLFLVIRQTLLKITTSNPRMS
jgi:hypothetical protein